MLKKQSKDRRNWGDHPLVAFIGTLAALVAIIVFVTGKENLSKFRSNSRLEKFQEEKDNTLRSLILKTFF